MGKEESTRTDSNSTDLIKEQIAELSSKDGVKRQKARHVLVEIGKDAVKDLSGLLEHPKDTVRWEAVKALSQIKDPMTARHLVQALGDESEGVRWVAAEGLISLHKAGLVALLQVLAEAKNTVFLKTGAHHVVKTLAEQYDFEGKAELIGTLENNAAHLEIPIISRKVLDILMRDPHGFRYNV
jgi:HEAT repeat protein